jgi:hypothetical protein
MENQIFKTVTLLSKLMRVYGMDAMLCIAIVESIKAIFALKNSKLTDKSPEYGLLLRNRDLYADYVYKENPEIDLSSSNTGDFIETFNKFIKQLKTIDATSLGFIYRSIAIECLQKIARNKEIILPETDSEIILLIEGCYTAEKLNK